MSRVERGWVARSIDSFWLMFRSVGGTFGAPWLNMPSCSSDAENRGYSVSIKEI